jgi:hypothetical protein
VQPLQSVNCHDSRAHSHERLGPFTRLARFDWVGFVGFECSQFGSWYAAGAKPACMVLGLATCGMPVSVGQFWLQVSLLRVCGP